MEHVVIIAWGGHSSPFDENNGPIFVDHHMLAHDVFHNKVKQKVSWRSSRHPGSDKSHE
jgi:hypothetical protein